jgi:two-component SAPR family response regulator
MDFTPVVRRASPPVRAQLSPCTSRCSGRWRSARTATRGEIVEVTGARLRALLIMLALHPGQLVTVSQLIDGLWPQEMPAGAGNALQALISRLSRALPEAVLESRPSGYQLNIDPRCTDIVRFEDLVTAGRAQLRDDPAAAGQTLRQALALWRGPALADVADTDFGQAAVARLDRLGSLSDAAETGTVALPERA